MVTTTTATRSSLLAGFTMIKISCLIVVILLISSPLPINALSLQSQLQLHNHYSVLINGGGHQQKQRYGQFLQRRQVLLSPQVGQQQQQQLSRHSSILYLKSTSGNNNDDDDNNNSINKGASSLLSSSQQQQQKLLSLETIGLLCQPVVWISLYFVKTTGGGLPAGPGGLIGAIEGLSYLLVVIFALFPSLLPSSSFYEQQQQDNGDDDDSVIVTITTKTMTIVEVTTLSSRITLVLGLLTLIGLIVDQGCIPNAKPILDYSAYLPICNIPPS